MKYSSPAEALAEEPAEKYRLIEIGSNQVLLYDRENTAAWIQSDCTVELSEYTRGLR